MVAVFWLIYTVLGIYTWCLIAHIILSWLTAFGVINTHQPFVQTVSHFLYSIIEPAARPIRRYMPNLNGIDLSILALFLGIKFIEIFLKTSIEPLFFG